MKIVENAPVKTVEEKNCMLRPCRGGGPGQGIGLPVGEAYGG